MILNPLPGFKSFITRHCVTGSMRHIYEFYGYPVSESLLLGLGAGMGFVYWHMKGAPPFFGGRANVGRPGEEGLEKTAGKRTGVRVEFFQTSSVRKTEKALLEMLDEGQPVMIQCDMGFLPYFNFGGQEYHFGGHVVVVCGVDLKARQVLIADREVKLHLVSMDDLAKARGSTFKPFPPKNKWYTFDFSKVHPPRADDVRQAIREMSTGMLAPPITNLGVKGIRKTAQRILKWPDVLDEGTLRGALFNGFVFIDAMGGTGGGIFRYMFSRFLREAAGITGEIRFNESADAFQDIGDRWQTVAEMFKEAGQAEGRTPALPAISNAVLELADLEEAAWIHLSALIS